MPTPARIQESMFAWGFRKQTNIIKPAIAADCWRLNKLDGLLKAELVIEDDAAEMGKGHEFATQSFLSHSNVTGSIDTYLSSEWAAFVMSFGLGGVSKGGTTHLTYTCVPLVPATALELPYFTFLETIRQGGSAVLDRAALGCVLNSWLLTVGTGPGRANAKLRADFIGSGKVIEPSSIVMPVAATAEHPLFGASVAAAINGVDYVTVKNLVSLEAGWNNNVAADQGFYPGSGFQTDVAFAITADPDTDIITAAGMAPVNGEVVRFATTGTLPTGLAAYTQYYVRDSAGDTFKVAASPGGMAINITGAGSNSTVLRYDATSGAIRGRHEIGTRAASLKFVARFLNGSDELTKLKGQTPGTAVVSLTYDVNNSLILTFNQVKYKIVDLGETNGIVTVAVDCQCEHHSTLGVLSAVAKCDIDNICQAPA